MKSIEEQLTEIYLKEEWWHNNFLSYEESINYHKYMIKQGNLIYTQKSGKLLGYVEFFRVNFEQFGRLICKAPFFNYDEDLLSGNICYVSNVWIKKDFRAGETFGILKLLFFELNSHCEYYAGSRLKKSQPIKVFKKSELVNNLFKTGVT